MRRRLLSDAGREVARLALGSETPYDRSFGGIERVQCIARGIDNAIGGDKAAIDAITSLITPALDAVCAQGIDVVIARSDKDDIVGHHWRR